MDNLIKRAQKRDPDAFSQLIQEQMQHMYKTARAILYNEEDAADAISETILTCWEKLDTLKKPQFFRTWLTRILVNKCNDILRKKELLSYTDEIPEVPVQDKEYANLEWKEALNSLDEKYRLVIMLYYVQGFGTKEISQILDLPESTIRTRLSRAREKMASQFYPEVQRRKFS